jgi:glycosyltransferase involved in cell wall biosynthesis
MIIVLTPVKNEEWILAQFLAATSLFADCIIIADQNSTDNSREICSKFPKVKLISNINKEYNESERQILLIESARVFFPNEEKIFFALDADEILSADSLNAKGWETIANAPKGTVFRFEKPTIFFDTSKTIRYSDGWPLAFKDDGTQHEPKMIHSTRVPTPKHAEQILIKDIKFLHLCFVRENIQFSKNRFYCAIENVNKIRSLRNRQRMYNKYTSVDYANEGMLESTQQSWFEYYDKNGIELKNFKESQFYWMDFEVLRMFQKYGTNRFFNDSIWHFDWEACRIEALARKIDGIPLQPIICPSIGRIKLTDILFRLLNKIIEMKNKFATK